MQLCCQSSEFGVRSPELSKSYMYMASKIFTFTITFKCTIVFETQGGTRNRTQDLPEKGSAFILSSDHWTKNMWGHEQKA